MGRVGGVAVMVLVVVSELMTFLHVGNGKIEVASEPFKKRKEGEKESSALKNAIEFYNLTATMEDKMISAFRHDYYEDIISKDAPKLKVQMDDLEKKLLSHIRLMEASGGATVPGDRKNSIHGFVDNLESEYDAMVKDTKLFTERLLEAFKALKADKLKLMNEADKFAEMKEKHLEFKPVFAGGEIYLWGPSTYAKSVERIELSVLEDLLKLYKEMDKIEDQVDKVWTNPAYANYENVDPESEEHKIISAAVEKVEKIHARIRNVVTQNDNMLRHFEKVVNKEVIRLHALLPETEKRIDEMQDRVMKLAKEFSTQDIKIRQLSAKFNSYLIEANKSAMKRLIDEGHGDHVHTRVEL